MATRHLSTIEHEKQAIGQLVDPINALANTALERLRGALILPLGHLQDIPNLVYQQAHQPIFVSENNIHGGLPLRPLAEEEQLSQVYCGDDLSP
jgi:hypothetical protein